MSGNKSFSNLIDEPPSERRVPSGDHVQEILHGNRQKMLLAELRKHSGMTQKKLAEKLGITQPSLSQMEGQEDMQIRTLHRLVDSLGGRLELVVQMPAGEVVLNQFSDS